MRVGVGKEMRDGRGGSDLCWADVLLVYRRIARAVNSIALMDAMYVYFIVWLQE